MKRLPAAFLSMLLSTLPVAATPPSDIPNAPARSIAEQRSAIAWYGAACLLGSSELDLFGQVIRVDDIASESGVSPDRIREMANARRTEHDIAVAVLRRGGEPLQEPPEPFLTILRQAQADCQDLEIARRRLERALDTGALPDTVPVPDRPLRAALDPFPFDFERRQRLAEVIRHIGTALAAGDFAADLDALLQAVSQRDGLTVRDIADMETFYALLPDADAIRAMATDLLLPNPEGQTDLSRPELDDLLSRLADSEADDFGRYYGWLVLANRASLESDMDFRALDQHGDEIDPDALLGNACRRVADSAAMACDFD